MTLLLVDDDKQIQKNWEEFSETIGKRSWEENKIRLLKSSSAEEASENMKKDRIDFLIVDLRLGSEKTDGNKLIKDISNLYLRVPTIVVTATPDDVEDQSKVLKVYKKGENDSISDIIEYLLSVYKTGISEILGKSGLIESLITQIYEKSLLPYTKEWLEYGKTDSGNTKAALLRYTLNHLYDLLDEGTKKYYPEEMYIKSIAESKLATGSLLKKGETDYIVLSPACDLVKRNGDFKTDSILLVKIELLKTIIESSKSSEIENLSKKKLKYLLENKETLYYHWLPNTSIFHGGIINFRKVVSISKDDIQNYCFYNIQISPFFIKDIISRFSSFYARQGQPDIYNDNHLNDLIAQNVKI